MTKVTLEKVLPLIAEGLPQVVIAENLGVRSTTVNLFIKRHKLTKLFWTKRNLGRQAGARELAMKSRYENGETLQAIAVDYGVTRERVRQLLTKHFGFTAKDGGSRKRSEKRAEARRTRLDARCLERFGHDHAAHMELRELGRGLPWNLSPIGVYVNQRRNARRRGIGWQFTLASWWRVWNESGKWPERGRGRGYCMCRYYDQGPYSPDNCYIATGVENVHDYYDRRDIAKTHGVQP